MALERAWSDGSTAPTRSEGFNYSRRSAGSCSVTHTCLSRCRQLRSVISTLSTTYNSLTNVTKPMKTFVSSQVALYIGMVLAAQVGFLLRFVIPGISAGESVVWVLVPDAIVIMAGITAVSFHRRFCFLVRTDGETTVHVWGIGIDCRFHRRESKFELLSWRGLQL